MQVTAMQNVSYYEKISRPGYAAAGAAGPSNPKDAVALAESVTISPAGRAMNEAISKATNGGVAPERTGLLGNLPSWSLDYKQASKRAEDGLKEAMAQLGIPAGTKLDISVDPYDGTISVKSDSSKNAELEAIVNNNGELRNSIVAAESAAYLARIGNAAEQAQMAAGRNPSKAEQYFSWLDTVVKSVQSMGFSFEFRDGGLTGSFLSGGEKIGIDERLPTLVA